MLKYRIISGRRGRAFVQIEEKIRAIAEIYIGGKAREKVLRPIYQKYGKELPRNTSVIVQNWKKSIQDKLDKSDAHTIRLCKDFEIIEEIPDGQSEKRVKGARRGRPRKKP